MTENCWDGDFANVLQEQKESHTSILITTRRMMCVANTCIAEGGSVLTGVITKNLVLTTTANTDICKLGEMWNDVNTSYRCSISWIVKETPIPVWRQIRNELLWVKGREVSSSLYYWTCENLQYFSNIKLPFYRDPAWASS